MDERIVIVGNGIAAINAIKAIREIDDESLIILIGEESFYPYNRIRLSKGLFSSLEEDKILLQKTKWYDENNIEIYLNRKVITISPQKKQIELSDGTEIEYTKLLLATGASNLTPPIKGIDKEGVFTLRTLQDAWDIKDNVKDSKRILIIGGGIQGLEIASNLSKQEKEVVVAEISSWLMPRELDKEASKILEESIINDDIDILLNTEIEEIVGQDKVEGFVTKEGNQRECDMIIYSTGIEPNINILEGTNIERSKGIIVNKKMETNISDIYAIGDVVEFDDQIYGLWNIAIEQGKTAGYNIAGRDKSYHQIVPVITLRAFGISLFSMGVTNEDKATDIIVEKDNKEKVYSKILIDNDRVIGAIVVGNIKKSPALKRAIEERVELNGIDFNNVSVEEIIEIIKNK